MTGRHLLAWAVLIAVLTAGCGVRPSGVITGDPAPVKQVGDSPGPPPTWSAILYFATGPGLTRVLRPTRQPLSPVQVLALLQDGPDGDERATGLTSEVPVGLDPATVTTGASGVVDVVVSVDVTTLSTTAVDQIACTVRDALPTAAPVTVTSGAATLGPRTCPLPG